MEIKDYYKNKTIFITGTTGFVGKVVLEKIMRTLVDFKKIFIMVRQKKGMTDLQRLEEIFQSEIFEPLFRMKPQLKTDWKLKVFLVAGDLTLSGLGLSPESKQTIIDEV